MTIYRDRRLLIPFRSALLPQIFTDTLVIGTGVAGLRAAIEAARHGDVIVLAKEAVDHSNTSWAQGGIAAVLAHGDTVDSHLRDTLDAGAGLCDEAAVRTLFSAHGTVESVALITDRDTGQPRGFGFVEMSNADAARAIQVLNGHQMDGRALKVNEAQPKTKGDRPHRAW